VTSPSKPELGDLVNWRGEVGIVQQSRGIDIKVYWVKPWVQDNRLIDFSWMRRANVKVISRA
jgi:hypothetical protein